MFGVDISELAVLISAIVSCKFVFEIPLTLHCRLIASQQQLWSMCDL